MKKQDKFQFIAGVTKDNEIYFIEIKNDKYFSMSGFTVEPKELEEAKDMSRESIIELIEQETTNINPLFVRDINDIADDIIESDGNLSGIDTSLYPDTVEVDGDEYAFISSACGQHKEKELALYFIDETDYSVLLSIWQKYHLKTVDVEKDFTQVERITYMKMLELGYFKSGKSQDKEKTLQEAIRFINKNLYI